VDFDLSEEQRALRDAARELLARSASMERVRAALGTPYDERLWREMAAQGWLALEVPEADGGLGLGFVETVVLAEQVGRYVAPAPFLSTSLVLGALRAHDPELAARLAGGEAIGATGLAGRPIVDAPAAEVIVVIDGDRVTAYRPAETVRAEPAMDQTRSLGWVNTEGQSDELGGAALATALLDRGATGYAAAMLGASERMLEVSVDYAKTREQFGRPIGQFQAVKHRCADMLVDVEGMRSAVYYAAWAIEAGASDASLAASTAKAWASDAARRVMGSALQVHGGIGFTWEHDLHLYLKRAQLDGVTFGDATYHRERIATLLSGKVAAGEPLF
jgi:alkylation response protein AidB-like acyl-CoA dehydrogenase